MCIQEQEKYLYVRGYSVAMRVRKQCRRSRALTSESIEHIVYSIEEMIRKAS